MGLMSKISTRNDNPASPAPSPAKTAYSLPEKKLSAEISSSAAALISPAAPSIAPSQKKTRSDEFPRLPHDENFLATKIPCATCSSEWFWESIYFDGVIRCGECEKFPGWNFVGRKIVRSFFENGNGEREYFFEQRITDGRAPRSEAARDSAVGRTGNSTTLVDGAGDTADGGDAAVADCDYGQAGDSAGATSVDELEANAFADQFVEYQTADGRTGYALRGFNHPKHRNYDQRVNAYVVIGVGEYDRRLKKLQGVWRADVVKG